MVDIVVIGGGGHAKVVISVLNKINDYSIYGYVSKESGGEVLGVQYLGTDEILPSLLHVHGVKYAAMGIGFSVPAGARSEIADSIIGMGFEFPPVVSPDSFSSSHVLLDEGVFINDAASIGPDVKIGRFAIVNRCSSVDHDSIIGNFVHIAPNAALAGGVVVGNHVQIGIGAIITEYLEVIDGSIIGAGAVIVKDCHERGTYVGIPGKLL